MLRLISWEYVIRIRPILSLERLASPPLEFLLVIDQGVGACFILWWIAVTWDPYECDAAVKKVKNRSR